MITIGMERVADACFDGWEFDDVPDSLHDALNEILSERLDVVFDMENGAFSMLRLQSDLTIWVNLELNNCETFAQGKTSLLRLVEDAIDCGQDRIDIAEALMGLVRDILKGARPSESLASEMKVSAGETVNKEI